MMGDVHSDSAFPGRESGLQRPAGSARLARSRARATRRTLRVGLALVCGLALLLVLLLTQATRNHVLYERNFLWLLGVNIFVAVVLFSMLLWAAVRLGLRLKRGHFGSRLLAKLAGIFGLVGVVPGLVIYVVSYQFVSRSIESWFDVRVEGALTAGVNLARLALDTIAADFAAQTRTASGQLSRVPDAAAGLVLERMREQLGASDLVLWNARGELLASVGQSRFDLNPTRPNMQQLQQLRATGSQRVVYQIEGLESVVERAHSDVSAAESRAVGDADANSVAAEMGLVRVRALTVVRNPTVGLLAEPRFVQSTLVLPAVLVANAIAVQQANREYQERALARVGLRRMYIGTLTLALFLAVFSVVLLAVALGHQIVRPLLVLADGVREVAAGNLAPKAALQTRDELGGLTRSFALMTNQLAEARMSAQQSMAALDAARARLQTILDNLTAGVIVLDAQGTIRSSNPGASRILRLPLVDWWGQSLAQVPGMADFAVAVQQQFDIFLRERDPHSHRPHWQHSFELHGDAVSSGQSGDSGVAVHVVTYLVARGAELPDAARLLVFDDISQIVSAQRAQAWGEVARRLAHEIKNPLTPIQLSAERLAMKLEGKLPAVEQAIVTKSVHTIVDQVDALLRLVNEFRDYARLPAARLYPINLNTLVSDVLQLYGPETAAVPVRAELDPDCPLIVGDAQQLRQVIHNLLQNSQDATQQAAQAGHSSLALPFVRIVTHWNASTQRVRLTVFDRGQGFPESILQRAFEPYITTKPRGTGLGLAVVKKIADEHGARIDLRNYTENGAVSGAQVSLSFAPAREVA